MIETVKKDKITYKDVPEHLCNLYRAMLELIKVFIMDPEPNDVIEEYIVELYENFRQIDAQFDECKIGDINDYFVTDLLKLDVSKFKRETDQSYLFSFKKIDENNQEEKDEITIFDFGKEPEEDDYFELTILFDKIILDFKNDQSNEPIMKFELMRKLFQVGDTYYSLSFLQYLSRHFKSNISEIEKLRNFGNNERSLLKNNTFTVFKNIYEIYVKLRTFEYFKDELTAKEILIKIFEYFKNPENWKDEELFVDNIVINDLKKNYSMIIPFFLKIIYDDMSNQQNINRDLFDSLNKTYKYQKIYFSAIKEFDNKVRIMEFVTAEIKFFKEFFQKKLGIFYTMSKIKNNQLPLLESIEKSGDENRHMRKRKYSELDFKVDDKDPDMKTLIKDINEFPEHVATFIEEEDEDGKIIMIKIIITMIKKKMINTDKKFDERFFDVIYDYIFKYLSEINHSILENFLKFVDWMIKEKKLPFVLDKELHPTIIFDGLATSIFFNEVILMYPLVHKVLGECTDYDPLERTSKNGKNDCKKYINKYSQIFDYLDKDVRDNLLKKHKYKNPIFMITNFDQLLFVIESFTIYQHYPVDQEAKKYHDVKLTFAQIYRFLLNIRVELVVSDKNFYRQTFEFMEECLDFTYKYQQKSNQINIFRDAQRVCTESFADYSEIYWFLKYFQYIEIENKEVFFEIYNGPLKDKKFQFQAFLAYIIDQKTFDHGKTYFSEICEDQGDSQLQNSGMGDLITPICFVYFAYDNVNEVISDNGQPFTVDAYQSIVYYLHQYQKHFTWPLFDLFQYMELFKGFDKFELYKSFYNSYVTNDPKIDPKLKRNPLTKFLVKNQSNKNFFDLPSKAEFPDFVDYIEAKFRPNQRFFIDYKRLYNVIQRIFKESQKSGKEKNEFDIKNPEDIEYHLTNFTYTHIAKIQKEDTLEQRELMNIGIGIFLFFAKSDKNYQVLLNSIQDHHSYFILHQDKNLTLKFIRQLDSYFSQYEDEHMDDIPEKIIKYEMGLLRKFLVYEQDQVEELSDGILKNFKDSLREELNMEKEVIVEKKVEMKKSVVLNKLARNLRPTKGKLLFIEQIVQTEKREKKKPEVVKFQVKKRDDISEFSGISIDTNNGLEMDGGSIEENLGLEDIKDELQQMTVQSLSYKKTEEKDMSVKKKSLISKSMIIKLDEQAKVIEKNAFTKFNMGIRTTSHSSLNTNEGMMGYLDKESQQYALDENKVTERIQIENLQKQQKHLENHQNEYKKYDDIQENQTSYEKRQFDFKVPAGELSESQLPKYKELIQNKIEQQLANNSDYNINVQAKLMENLSSSLKTSEQRII